MSRSKIVSKWLLGILFVVAGANHFLRPEFYLRIMPAYLPWHRALVEISGVAEIVLGVLLLIPKTSRCAAWGLIALLIAVFPANLNMAMHAANFPEMEPWMLWARLPLQAVLIGWAWSFTRNG